MAPSSPHSFLNSFPQGNGLWAIDSMTRAKATVKTSSDGFKKAQSERRICVQDGVNSHSLTDMTDVSRAVCLRLDLARGENAAATSAVDAFRIRAEAANVAVRK